MPGKRKTTKRRGDNRIDSRPDTWEADYRRTGKWEYALLAIRRASKRDEDAPQWALEAADDFPNSLKWEYALLAIRRASERDEDTPKWALEAADDLADRVHEQDWTPKDVKELTKVSAPELVLEEMIFSTGSPLKSPI